MPVLGFDDNVCERVLGLDRPLSIEQIQEIQFYVAGQAAADEPFPAKEHERALLLAAKRSAAFWRGFLEPWILMGNQSEEGEGTGPRLWMEVRKIPAYAWDEFLDHLQEFISEAPGVEETIAAAMPRWREKSQHAHEIGQKIIPRIHITGPAVWALMYKVFVADDGCPTFMKPSTRKLVLAILEAQYLHQRTADRKAAEKKLTLAKEAIRQQQALAVAAELKAAQERGEEEEYLAALQRKIDETLLPPPFLVEQRKIEEEQITKMIEAPAPGQEIKKTPPKGEWYDWL